MITVIASSMTIQPVLAFAPVVSITGASTPIGPFFNGGTISIPSTQTTIRVTFQYRGMDDDNHIRNFECSWDGGTYSQSNCPSLSPESRMMLRGPDGIIRNYYFKDGTASRDLAATSTPHTFGVKVVNDAGTRSNPVTWTYTISHAMTSTPVPSVRITRLLEGHGFVASESFPSDNGDVVVFTAAQGDGLSRLCVTFGSGPIPSNPSIPTSARSSASTTGCHNSTVNEPITEFLISTGVNPGLKYVCVAVWNRNNIRSTPSCSSFAVVSRDMLIGAPVTQITVHKPFTGTGYEDLEDGQTTQYRNMQFEFSANPRPGMAFDPNREATFSCRWDAQGPWNPCGQIHAALFPSPCIGTRPGFSCPTPVLFLVAYQGIDSVRGVSNGRHSVDVISRYGLSTIGPRASFTWCVVTCNAPTSDQRITEENRHTGSASMITEANQSSASIVPFAGLDKVVNKNTNVVLKGSLLVIPPPNFPINGTISDLKQILPPFDIKSIVWKQISGPEVKLNSTDTLAVQFRAPDIDADLEFNFTATDDKGVNKSDLVYVWAHTINQTGSTPKDNQTSATQDQGEQLGGKAIKEEQPSTKEEQPSTKEEQPSTKEEQPSTKEEQPSTKEEQPPEDVPG